MTEQDRILQRALSILNSKSYSRESFLQNTDDQYLFHGATSIIEGSIKPNVNRSVCDFGNGFYTGNVLAQAEARVNNEKNSYVYVFEYDLKDLTTYEIVDTRLWAFTIGYCRNKFRDNLPDELMKTINKILSHDVVIGYIADDKIARAFRDFVDGNITDVGLSACLSLVKYGKQFVFKTDKAISHLHEVFKYKLSSDDKISNLSQMRKMKENMNTNIESIKRSTMRTGKFFFELLEDTAWLTNIRI